MIPRAPLIIGLLGLLPFFWGALSMTSGTLSDLGAQWMGPRFVGPYVQLAYGTTILSFLSGALWGFATRADPAIARSAYGLAVIPAIWAFLFVGDGPTSSAIYLLAGFLGTLGLDWLYWKNNLTPHWWFRFRLMLTILVVLTLIVTIVSLHG